MHKKFLIRGKFNETMFMEIINPILRGVDRTTHKVTYRTSKGVVEIVSIPLRSNPGRYGDVVVSGTLRKIFLWNLNSTEELEQLLQSHGIDMVEIIKDGPKTLELKK